jgi:hypothetical protein
MKSASFRGAAGPGLEAGMQSCNRISPGSYADKGELEISSDVCFFLYVFIAVSSGLSMFRSTPAPPLQILQVSRTTAFPEGHIDQGIIALSRYMVDSLALAVYISLDDAFCGRAHAFQTAASNSGSTAARR